MIKICEACNKKYNITSKKQIKNNIGCSPKCGKYINYINKIKKYDWNEIQEYHNLGNNLNNILKKFKMTSYVLKKAIEINLFKYTKTKYQHSDNMKKHLSEKRINYLLNNKDKHVWKKNSKFISVPCEILKNILNDNNISYIEEYSPLKECNYSLDIAFPDKMLALEINGNQHYNKDGSLKEYYKKRENIFISNNWKIIQIHYLLCYNNDYINNLLKFINNTTSINDFIYNNYIPKIKKIKITKKEKYEQKQQYYYNIITNSNIDFNKFGWVQKLSVILNIKPQHINKIMKKYLLHFYNTNCYKRKNTGNENHQGKMRHTANVIDRNKI